jgi:hypothetical protein
MFLQTPPEFLQGDARFLAPLGHDRQVMQVFQQLLVPSDRHNDGPPSTFGVNEVLVL